MTFGAAERIGASLEPLKNEKFGGQYDSREAETGSHFDVAGWVDMVHGHYSYVDYMDETTAGACYGDGEGSPVGALRY